MMTVNQGFDYDILLRAQPVGGSEQRVAGACTKTQPQGICGVSTG
jgi:hypothetical protein